MTLQVLSENSPHVIEEPVLAWNGEPQVDAEQMDAYQSPVQVEEREASQVETKDQLEH